MAAAYAALHSLAQSLSQILNLEHYISPLHKEKIVFLHEKVDFMLTFLEDYSEKNRGTLGYFGNRIRESSYELQDLIDSYLCAASRANSGSSSSDVNWDKESLDHDLNMALERINFIWEESMKVKNDNIGEDLRSRSHSSLVDHSSTVEITVRNMVVGLDDDLNAIKEQLYGDSTALQTIPIVGMGGIGKTTLARRAYEDSIPAMDFDIYAWITVSQEHQRRQILLGLLRDLKPNNELSGLSDAELGILVYQNLICRRYLIVIDDIWSTQAWDELKMIFPNDGNRSRILLTTRLSDVAVHAGSSSTLLHQMNFMNEDQSWKLLQKRIFGNESCPPQLENIGREIARKCWGLPLTIVVVAGLLLSTGNTMNEESWEHIFENLCSSEPTIELQCSKLLCLSYDWLPLRLKPCFLYIAAFPEDSKIDVSRLIKLWVAEGFLRPSDQFKCLEDVGEWYLEDLVNRSLILVNEERRDGKLETIKIHDLLREIAIKKAEEEDFLHHVSLKSNAQIETIENSNRRLSGQCTQNFQEWRILGSSIRSVLLFTRDCSVLRLHLSCGRLNTLDAPDVTWPCSLEVISTFVNLRYIAFHLYYDMSPHGFPASISKLSNLQTIIVYTYNVREYSHLEVPFAIWKMPKLRHLIMDTPFHLSDLSFIGTVHESDIQTLDRVINFRFTQEAIKIFVNLKKLEVEFRNFFMYWDVFNLNNLFHLQNLEELLVHVRDLWFYYPIKWNYDFPISLKMLTLAGVPFPWENMAIIGSLPNLRVLEMLEIRATKGSEWMPKEGQFLKLKFFYSSLDNLVRWEVEKEHFPCLEKLILWDVKSINEIPCGIGEIDSLQLIELQDCSKSLVNSAKQIQEQQHDNGNDAFQVLVLTWRFGYFPEQAGHRPKVWP